MSYIKTFEGFFSKDKKDDKDNTKKTKKKDFLGGLFKKEDDDFAQKVYNSLKLALKNDENSKIVGKITKYADYKRSVKFKSNGNDYIIIIQKSLLTRNNSNYVLVINNKHFIDKNGKPTISQRISRNIWDLLDKEYDKNIFNKEDITRDFD